MSEQAPSNAQATAVNANTRATHRSWLNKVRGLVAT
jgi:hypothetical protein